MSKRHNTKEYREWRKKIIARDKKCVICGSTEDLQSHHINDYSYHPTLRYKLDNGAAVCKACHINFHNNFKRSYRQKCTTYDWNNYNVLSSYFLSK